MNNIGLHIIGGTNLPLTKGNAKPRVVKLLDCSAAYYRQVRAAVGNDCLIVVRWYDANQPLGAPYENATGWFAKHRADIDAMKSPTTAFEGYNEVADSNAAAYAEVEYWRGKLLHGDDANCVYLNSSVGTPREDIWPLHQRWLNDMRKGDYVGVHEYASDTADVDNRWHCGRWTLIPQLAGKDIVVTEWGFDYLEDTKRGKPGWQLSTTADDFFNANVKYAALLRKYPNVRGAVIFQVGSSDPRWSPFDPTPIWPRILDNYVEEAAPVITPIFTIDGRQMSAAAFLQYVDTLPLKGKYNMVFIHHTAIPNEQQWDSSGGWEYRKQQMNEYYATVPIWYDASGVKHVGWDAGPHLFVDQVGIGLFTPLTQDGVGVYNHNTRTRHIEIVGDFTSHLPDGARLSNAVTAAAALLKAGGLTIDALHYHREFQSNTSCPGDLMVARWGWFKGLVAAKLKELNGMSQAEIEKVIGDEAQLHIIPLNPDAALERAMVVYGLLPASNEFDKVVDGVTYRCQAARSPGERQWQYIFYAEVSAWDTVKSFKRAN